MKNEFGMLVSFRWENSVFTKNNEKVSLKPYFTFSLSYVRESIVIVKKSILSFQWKYLFGGPQNPK